MLSSSATKVGEEPSPNDKVPNSDVGASVNDNALDPDGISNPDENEFEPHNISNVVLGTALLWFGWFGFNGGSNSASSLRAAMACVVTNLAASVAALTWMMMELL